MRNRERDMRKVKPIVFKEGAWSKHVPFAYELVRDLQPGILVELGTHKGESYFSLCQSVKEHNLPTVCYAIDTWTGDGHAGTYGDEVFLKVNEINENNFSNFSYLVRSTFEAAAGKFSNHSVDLLHIDGFHTYDAVKADFEGWIEKVSPGGVVLFHDIMVRHSDFGVWKFWEELQNKYETFEFKHGYGLGVLFKDSKKLQIRTSLIESMLEKNSEISLSLHDYYQSYYDELELAYKVKAFEAENQILKESCNKLEKQLHTLDQINQEQQLKISKVKEHVLFPFIKLFSKYKDI